MRFTPPSACKYLIIRLLWLAVKPITCQPAFFLLLYVLLGVPDIYILSFIRSFVPLSKAMNGFFLCYLLAFPVVLFPSSFRRFYKTVLLVFATFFFFVDICLLLLYNETFSTITKDAIAAVLATNPDETAEYINAYLTIDNLLIVSAILSVVFVSFYYLRKIRLKWNGICRCALLVLLLLSALKWLRQLDDIKESNLFYFITKECPDLREYRQNPSVKYDDVRVENVVLLLGESFSKFHSSLYGYEKETNSLLGKLESDNALFVYEKATSAGLSTIPSIKSIMTSYTNSMSDSIEWFRCLTLIEVMQKAGYKTYWFSNQSKTGIYDNEVGRFADLCDEQFFVGNKHGGLERNSLDEELLPVVENCLFDAASPKFIVVQLMGSHSEYKKRYPSAFSKFKGGDYIDSHLHLSSDKRQVLAEYDNSIFYNDSVVCELMKIFELEDALVMYFSDHGEDVYRSSYDLIGHGDVRVQDVVQQIPFMVYTSELFREKHPELQRRIESSVNRPYRTDSIMYTIMDIAGVETVNGVSYKHKSLFK